MKTQTSQGFTLVELMITIAIGAILTTIAIPSFSRLMQENGMTAATNDFVSTLNFARSEAVRRGENVGVCATTNSTTCSGSANWQTGWLVWHDADGNDALNGEEVLRVHESLGRNLTLIKQANTAPIVYSSTGIKTTAGAETLFVCDSGRTDELRRTVTVSPTGRNQSVKETSATGC